MGPGGSGGVWPPRRPRWGSTPGWGSSGKRRSRGRWRTGASVHDAWRAEARQAFQRVETRSAGPLGANYPSIATPRNPHTARSHGQGMIHVVLFDLGGTLIDTQDALTWSEVASDLGIVVDPD